MNHARIVELTSGFGTRFEVLRTAYESQTFSRHSHDTYTLGLVLDGAGTFWCRGTEHFARKGDLVVIPPGEVHTGSVGAGIGSLAYLAIYLPVGLAALHAEAAGARGERPPEFGQVVLRDPRVRRTFQALDRVIGSAAAFRHWHSSGNTGDPPPLDAASAQEAACIAITELIHHHAQWSTPNDRLEQKGGSVREPRLVQVVRDVLEQSYARADETSLRMLAHRTGVTPFRVIRAFREATGLAPHQYLIQVRVRRARQLLTEGTVPSLAALLTGFVDQSHLTFHFKKHLGITPGNYRRCVAIP